VKSSLRQTSQWDRARDYLGILKLIYIGHVNLPAFFAGVITVYLVFFGGPIIYLLSDKGEFIFGFAQVRIKLFGVEANLDFLNYLYISAKLSYLVSGVCLILGSISRDPRLSTELIGFRLPAVTGLILTLVLSVITTSIGVFSNGGLTISIDISVQGVEESISTTLYPRVSPTLVLTVIGNILAIIGRLGADRVRVALENRHISRANYVPSLIPLLP